MQEERGGHQIVELEVTAPQIRRLEVVHIGYSGVSIVHSRGTMCLGCLLCTSLPKIQTRLLREAYEVLEVHTYNCSSMGGPVCQLDFINANRCVYDLIFSAS